MNLATNEFSKDKIMDEQFATQKKQAKVEAVVASKTTFFIQPLVIYGTSSKISIIAAAASLRQKIVIQFVVTKFVNLIGRIFPSCTRLRSLWGGAQWILIIHIADCLAAARKKIRTVVLTTTMLCLK